MLTRINYNDTKRQSFLRFPRLCRVPNYIHHGLLWVKAEFELPTLFDAAIFVIRRGLLSLLPDPKGNVIYVSFRELPKAEDAEELRKAS